MGLRYLVVFEQIPSYKDQSNIEPERGQVSSFPMIAGLLSFPSLHSCISSPSIFNNIYHNLSGRILNSGKRFPRSLTKAQLSWNFKILLVIKFNRNKFWISLIESLCSLVFIIEDNISSNDNIFEPWNCFPGLA